MDYDKKYLNLYDKAKAKKIDKGLIREERFEIISKFIKKYKKTGSILDYGAGDGHLRDFVDDNYKYYYLDISKNHFNNLKKNDVVLEFNSDFKIPLKNKTMDVIVLSEVIEHLPNPGLVLSDIKKVLKDDGLLIITTPNIFYSIFITKSLFRFNVDKTRQHIVGYDWSLLNNLLKNNGFDYIEHDIMVFFYPLYYILKPIDKLFSKIFKNNCYNIISVYKKE